MSELKVIDLDLKGKACPEPVIETRKVLSGLNQESKEVIITIQLDNRAACENVTRFAESQGFRVTREVSDDEIFTLTITRGFNCELPTLNRPESENAAAENSYLVYIDSAKMGCGDEKLGRILMKAFLKTLPELESLPQTIIFLNDGVFLTTSDSPELETLKNLEAAGCNILVCGTCLDFYNLKDKLEIGQVSNMFEIASLLTGPDKVVRI